MKEREREELPWCGVTLVAPSVKLKGSVIGVMEMMYVSTHCGDVEGGCQVTRSREFWV